MLYLSADGQKGKKGRKGTRAQGQKGKRAHGHTNRRADGQKARRPEQGQTQSLHTLTVVRQAATTSFPLVCPSHLSSLCFPSDVSPLGGAAFSLLLSVVLLSLIFLSVGAAVFLLLLGWCCFPPSSVWGGGALSPCTFCVCV